MSTTVSTLEAQLNDLKFDFIVSVSCIGAVCALLLVAVLGLVIWNIKMSKKIKSLDPFVNFKLQRPRLLLEESPQEDQRHSYDNPKYSKNPLSLQAPQEKRDLNPIAIRSKASFDNGNFSFGNPNKLSSNSFKTPDYLEQDNRFY